jgi:hypothetical protein
MVSLEVQLQSAGGSVKKSKGANWKVVTLMPLLFKTLDALYLETRKLPLAAKSGANRTPIIPFFIISLESTIA